MFAKARGETATILEIAGGEGVFGGFLRALRRSLSGSRVVRRERIAGLAAVRRMRRAVAERSGRAAPSPFAASAAPPSAGSGSRCGAAIRAPSAFADRRRDGAGCAHTSRPYAPKAFERAPDRVRRPRFSIQSNARALARFHDVPRLVRCSRTAQSPMSVRSGSSPRREGIVIEVFRIERRGAGRALRRSRCVMCVPCPVVACMLRNCGKFKL